MAYLVPMAVAWWVVCRPWEVEVRGFLSDSSSSSYNDTVLCFWKMLSIYKLFKRFIKTIIISVYIIEMAQSLKHFSRANTIIICNTYLDGISNMAGLWHYSANGCRALQVLNAQYIATNYKTIIYLSTDSTQQLDSQWRNVKFCRQLPPNCPFAAPSTEKINCIKQLFFIEFLRNRHNIVENLTKCTFL